MIKDIIENNEKVSPVSYEYEKLRECFPQYFDKDGNFNFEQFKNNLEKDKVNFANESFSLNFLGKQYARLQTGLDTETVITPNIEHNSKEENKNSNNIYICGDNLDALRHLRKAYTGKIQCIYIDPPYNTGSDDFVYPDKFEYTKEDLVEKINLSEEEAERIINLAGKSSHSAWLTFMLPRLSLARDLLSDDGIIFISIDINEVQTLKMICDEIFGYENFVSEFIIDKTAQGANQSLTFKMQHEYCLLYAKKDWCSINYDISSEMNEKKYKYKDEKGYYATTNTFDSINSPLISNKNRGYTIYYNENTQEAIVKDEYNKELDKFENYDKNLIEKGFTPIRPGIRNNVQYPWNWKKSRFLEEYKEELVFQKNKQGNLTIYHKNRNNGIVKDTTLKKFDTRQDGNKFLIELMGAKIFDYPKSIEMLKWILSKYKDNDCLILDFFSGSATTAHACMQLNAEDGGNRKFILVQLKEPTKEGSVARQHGFNTICDIGIERIKRASKKIKEDTNADIDYGFKIYNLNEVKEETIDKCLNFDELSQNAFIRDDYVKMFEFDNVGGIETILTTWKIKDGYDFSKEHLEIDLGGYSAYMCEKTLYLINQNIQTEHIKKLIELLDNDYKTVNNIVLYGYSFNLQQLQELKINIKQLSDSITISERY